MEKVTQLTAEQTQLFIAQMVANAQPMLALVPLTEENWLTEFGCLMAVNTPMGYVKMGDNQYDKLIAKRRVEAWTMIKPTLTAPDVVIEKIADCDSAERKTKLLFIKTFSDAHNKHTFFESVTVLRSGLEAAWKCR